MLYNIFHFLLVFISIVNNAMPESVAVLKKENQVLKVQVESLSETMQRRQDKFDQMQPLSSSGLVNTDPSTIRESHEFLSKGYDKLILFQAQVTAESKQAHSRLDELIEKIDAIGQAVDEREEYCDKF